jgi:adenine specific DNA methylase Mod
MGTLYYGDNLDILRRYLKDETVDLVYLDPPFNSAQNYNAFFHEKDGTDAASQIHAFEDTWHWDIETKKAYDAVTEQPGKVSDVMQAFYTFLGGNDMMAYLTMMSSRLVELRRVLKSTGSLYLHCDPTASHYLKLLCDAIMGKEHFRNEIIWQRTSSHNDSKKWMDVHDVLLYYAKSDDNLWNPTFTEHDPDYVKAFYRYEDNRGVYRLDHIIRSKTMGPRPNLSYEYKGYKPDWGWRTVREKLEALDKDNRIQWSDSGRPYLKRYLAEQKGTPIKSVITDIPPVGAMAQERMNYPTQKPVALLERHKP